MSPIQDICLASANKTYGLDGGLTSWADQASTGNGINVALIDGIPAVISTLKMTLMLVCILLVILQSKQTFLTLYWKAPVSSRALFDVSASTYHVNRASCHSWATPSSLVS